jgi:hypothetical protein
MIVSNSAWLGTAAKQPVFGLGHSTNKILRALCNLLNGLRLRAYLLVTATNLQTFPHRVALE